MLRDMFKKTYTRLENKHSARTEKHTPHVPDGMWKKCKYCRGMIFGEDVKKNLYACPKCGKYFRVHAYRRIALLADQGSFEEWNAQMPVSDPLLFPGYTEKLESVREKTRLQEAVVTGRAKIHGNPCVLCVCDARFFMASMGHVVGEKITLAVERAVEENLPVVMYTCSGGARMQEGIISLMQMAKTSAALKRLREKGQVYICVLTDPTTGGVTASFAMLGDVILAEPKALIGFAGPRVIAQTIGGRLPEGFQQAEFLLQHGFVDAIVSREKQRETLAQLLETHGKTYTPIPLEGDMTEQEENHQGEMSAWDQVVLSRSKERPTAGEYIRQLFPDFMELHGDRLYGDDPAIVGGIATFHGCPVTVIGQQKGKDLKENKERNFGMPSPEGYRKALRLMKEAEAFHRPVICLVDTPGAFCGIEAEERGQGEAIARNLQEMAALKVPTLSIVIGEGGSGGALALAVTNEVWIMEHAIYSILSPEGFASILYKDAKKCQEAAAQMKLTAPDLLQLGVVEKVIAEKTPATVETLWEIGIEMDRAICEFLNQYSQMSEEALVESRYQRFRKF